MSCFRTEGPQGENSPETEMFRERGRGRFERDRERGRFEIERGRGRFEIDRQRGFERERDDFIRGDDRNNFE